MESFLAVVLMALWILGGFITAQIAQRVFVPLLAYGLGAGRFASSSAFDGCTLGMVGGFVSVALPPFLARMKVNELWSFPIVFVGISLYGLVWLWCLGLGARKREWHINNGRVLGAKEQLFQPTFVRERQDYTQTDAFNGYSYYFLDLHDDEKKLATNAYNSKAECNRPRRC